ncbi:MAG: ATP-binding cassette domain-containing protein [Bacteroidota bacterium]
MLRFVAKFIKHRLLSKYAVYIIIGFILFVLPGIGSFDTKTMTVFVTTFLFIAGPIADLINRVDVITTINISINRLNQLESILKAGAPANWNAEAIPALKDPFESIRFKDIVFEYQNKDQTSSFKLGKLNVEVKKGELIFVIGGNGSGKSTFINLLSGLYQPIEGKIFYNNQELTEESYRAYRDQISCVFTDNYLFSENYDMFDFSENNHYFKELIKQMRLEGIATVDSEKNRVKTDLSKGQQKRLALIFTMLEDCEILIFDEWAAEQDPVFRRYFYRNILPQLKQQGKTVVAITHDDAYFDCADRIIKFEFGQIVKEMHPDELLSVS